MLSLRTVSPRFLLFSILAWKLVPRLVKKLKKKSYLHRFTTLLYNTLGYDFRYIKHVIVVVL